MSILAETTYFRNSFVSILSNSGSFTIKLLNQPFLNKNNKKATLLQPKLMSMFTF